MACNSFREALVSRVPGVKCRDEVVLTGHPKEPSVISRLQAPGTAQQALLPTSSLFNYGDPDLSFCDVLAAYPIETESDQPPTVDVEEFTDLMLFPDLMGVLEENLPGSFQDLPLYSLGGDGEPLDTKPRGVISSVGDGGEISPAESDASVDHFFNTFTDLTGFLQQLVEEAGPSDLNDLATSIAGSNDPLTTDAEPSAMDTTTLPTIVGSETACKNEECSPRCSAPSSDDDDDDDVDEAPPPKKARTSRSTAKAKYRQRRDKNNVASQRSRATRKQREAEMAVTAKELEADNARLRIRIDELTVIAEEARKCLVVALSRK